MEAMATKDEKLEAVIGGVDEARRVVRSYKGGRMMDLAKQLLPLLENSSSAYKQLRQLRYWSQPVPLALLFEFDDVLCLLLDLGLDPDMSVDYYDNTMLHIAVYKQNERVVRCLKEHGAVQRPNIRNELPGERSKWSGDFARTLEKSWKGQHVRGSLKRR